MTFSGVLHLFCTITYYGVIPLARVVHGKCSTRCPPSGTFHVPRGHSGITPLYHEVNIMIFLDSTTFYLKGTVN